MAGKSTGRVDLEVSTRLVGSDIQLRDGSTARLDAAHIARKLFRETRTGTTLDLNEMLAHYCQQVGATPEALAGPIAAEAREHGTSSSPVLNASFAPGAFGFRANDGMKDVERIDFNVEFTFRARNAPYSSGK